MVPLSLLLLVAWLPVAAAEPTVVIARPEGPTGGSWVSCGIVHAVGWVAYKRVRVLRGAAPERFIGIHSCPMWGRLRGLLRLTLDKRRPRLWPRPSFTVPVQKRPTFYVRKATPHAPPETRRVRRLLGMKREELPAPLRCSKLALRSGWTRCGPSLAIRLARGKVTAIRAKVALGMSCMEAAAWIGYRVGKGRGFPLRRRWGCSWPGISERHRLARGVRGVLRDGIFEIKFKR